MHVHANAKLGLAGRLAMVRCDGPRGSDGRALRPRPLFRRCRRVPGKQRQLTPLRGPGSGTDETRGLRGARSRKGAGTATIRSTRGGKWGVTLAP